MIKIDNLFVPEYIDSEGPYNSVYRHRDLARHSPVPNKHSSSTTHKHSYSTITQQTKTKEKRRVVTVSADSTS